MSRLVEVDGFYVEMKDGPDLLSESDPGITRTGGTDEAKKAAENLAKVSETTRSTIGKVCSHVLGAFEAANRPDELKVKFGIKLSGKAGIPYVTEGAGEAFVEIEATWKNESPTKTPPEPPKDDSGS